MGTWSLTATATWSERSKLKGGSDAMLVYPHIENRPLISSRDDMFSDTSARDIYQ